jgi:hypothetical protein
MRDPEFDKMMEDIMSDNTRPGRAGFKVAPGPSIIELINDEINSSIGDYKEGVERGLWTIQQANRAGRKPFYALKTAYAQACADGNSEIVRGVRTVQFIFETPYKWIAGERP